MSLCLYKSCEAIRGSRVELVSVSCSTMRVVQYVIVRGEEERSMEV